MGLITDIKTLVTSINAKIPTLSGDDVPVIAAIDQVTANANEVVVKSITAGDVNIGNVDIVTLPSGNLGAQAKAASLCVNPASDISDATYIGDIKFGESIPSGTAIIGKVGIDQTAGENHVEVIDVVPGVTATSLGKAEDAAHTSGDTGVMVLGVRKDTVANLAGTDGDYAPMPVGANGLYVDAHLGEVLSYLLDSIDVAKMSKGAITVAHNAITATATSAEVDCRGFNSLLVHWVSSATDKTWVISVTGAMGSGLTFVPLLDKTTGLAASEITTDISGFFVISNIPDYIKIVATETDDGATVTCKVQPFNS